MRHRLRDERIMPYAKRKIQCHYYLQDNQKNISEGLKFTSSALFHLHDLRQSSSPTVWEILSSIIGAESKHHHHRPMRKEVREGGDRAHQHEHEERRRIRLQLIALVIQRAADRA